MKVITPNILAISFLMASWVVDFAWAASTPPALPKAQRETGAKGYLFVSSHDEIVAKAKREGRLRVLSRV